jgi:hypothetical protein
MLPNHTLTPGAISTADVATVCTPGYATHVRPGRTLWRRLKDEGYARYGIARRYQSIVATNGARYPAYQIDHLIPLELGGDPTDIRNLWPEPMASAKSKDDVENRLHELVCAGRVELSEAQRAIAREWTVALPNAADR